MSINSKLLHQNADAFQNLANLSLQLKSLPKPGENDSKSSTPSTDCGFNTDQPVKTKQHAKYTSLFNQQRQAQKSIFQNVSKNILASGSEKQLRTNSAAPIFKNQQMNQQISNVKKQSPYKSIITSAKPILQEDYSSHPFKHLIRGTNLTRLKFFQFLDEIQSQLKFSKLLKAPGLSALRNKKVKLNEQNTKPTLVLDMDETLIHSVFNPRLGKHSVQINSQFQKYQQYFNIRPYAIELLKELSQIYEIIIFSASIKEYVTSICNYLDPEKKYISQILSRDNCYITPSGYLVKDLRVLENRNLDRVIIVDNLALCFAFQIQNGIPILSWMGDQKDDELKYLIDYLKELSQEQNITEKNYQNLKLNVLTNLTKAQIYHPK